MKKKKDLNIFMLCVLLAILICFVISCAEENIPINTGNIVIPVTPEEPEPEEPTTEDPTTKYNTPATQGETVFIYKSNINDLIFNLKEGYDSAPVRNITVTNTGEFAAEIKTIEHRKENGEVINDLFDFNFNPDINPVLPGDSFTFTMQPKMGLEARLGEHTHLTVIYNENDVTDIKSKSGNNLVYPIVSLSVESDGYGYFISSPSQLKFSLDIALGKNQPDAQIIKIKNTSLANSAIRISLNNNNQGGRFFELSTNVIQTINQSIFMYIKAGDEIDLKVQPEAGLSPGAYLNLIFVEYQIGYDEKHKAPVNTYLYVPLYYEVIDSSVQTLELSPKYLSFNPKLEGFDYNKTKTITMTNTGTTPITVTNIALNNNNSKDDIALCAMFELLFHLENNQIMPGESANIEVRPIQGGTSNSYSFVNFFGNYIFVTYNNGQTAISNVAIHWEYLDISPQTLNFDTVSQGYGKKITLKNMFPLAGYRVFPIKGIFLDGSNADAFDLTFDGNELHIGPDSPGLIHNVYDFAGNIDKNMNLINLMVQPKTGLASGEYSANIVLLSYNAVTFYQNSILLATIPISFTVR